MIDFNELGEIVYQQKTAFSKVEDLVKRIESADSLDALKAELQSNYAKYFKDYFEQQDFEKKWRRCFEIRNKVAHNNLFVQEDLEDTFEILESLTIIINNADEKIDEAFFSIAEKEALKIATEKAEFINSQLVINEHTELELNQDSDGIQLNEQRKELPYEQLKRPYKLISEDEILKQLTEFEPRFKDGFIGLRHFVTEILASQGYSYSPSYAVINILADKKKIEIYDVDNPYGVMPTKAIKLLNKEVESLQ